MAESNFNPATISFNVSTPDQALETWIKATGGRGMTLVTAGQSGSGKSTLVKNLLRFKDNDRKKPQILHSPTSVTETVQVYNETVNYVPVKIVDMPGLVVPDQNEKKIIDQLKEETNGEADMLLYCVSMAPCSKLGIVDKGIIKLLTSIFKEQIWERTILVLTFADLAKNESSATRDIKAMKQDLEQTINNYAKEFERILSTIVKPKFRQLSVCPLDPNDLKSLRDPLQIAAITTSKYHHEKILYEYSWDNYIYLEVLRKCNREAIPAFLKISKYTPEQ